MTMGCNGMNWKPVVGILDGIEKKEPTIYTLKLGIYNEMFFWENSPITIYIKQIHLWFQMCVNPTLNHQTKPY